MALNDRAFQAEPAPVDDAPRSAPKPIPERLHLRVVRELAIHDWIVVYYLTILTLAVSMSEDSPVRTRCLGHVALMLAFAVAVLTFVRGGLVKDNFVAPLAYRVAVYGTVQISYFELRELLPLVNPSTLDA